MGDPVFNDDRIPDAIRVSASKDVAKEDIDHAGQAVRHGLAHAPEPVLCGTVRLSSLADPAVANPALVSIRVDLNGRPVHAHAAAADMPAAIALAADRLRSRLRRVARHWEARRGHSGPRRVRRPRVSQGRR
jgi:ribosome-associated translation inhibitor RaiA